MKFLREKRKKGERQKIALGASWKRQVFPWQIFNKCKVRRGVTEIFQHTERGRKRKTDICWN